MSKAKEPSSQQLDRATRTLGGALVLSAKHFTIQYILVPFVLFFIGLTGTVSTAIARGLSALAVAIIYNTVVLWPTSWRWRYLDMGAIMLFILAVFLVDDIQAYFDF